MLIVQLFALPLFTTNKVCPPRLYFQSCLEIQHTMKFTTPFLVAIFGLASASTVAGNFLKVSPGNSWADYCQPGGSKFDTHHLCVSSSPSFLKLLIKESHYEGYLAPNGKGEYERQQRLRKQLLPFYLLQSAQFVT